jgi:UDPglucose--hexose-1-phosphate uridylyltransferase
MRMELRSQAIEGELLDPDNGFAPARIRLEQRWDPLTGHSSRLVQSPDALFPPNRFDLARLAEQTRTGCPFCPDLIETVTPKFAPSIWPKGRIRRGQALLFPNLRAYARHTSVAVYGPELHYLPLERLEERLVGDNLAAQVDFARAVLAADPASAWVSVNANHMLPSGSSLFHPHT